MLTHERLLELLHYDPEIGVWTWRVNRSGGARAGSQAGAIRVSRQGRDSRRLMHVDGRLYYSSRLAFLYMTGEWPPQLVDHIDGDGQNDKWENLRTASYGENNTNRLAYGASGIKGVVFRRGRIYAQITRNGRTRSLGRFPDVDAASAAYQAASHKHYPNFARQESCSIPSNALPMISSPPLQSASTKQQSDAPANPL